MENFIFDAVQLNKIPGLLKGIPIFTALSIFKDLRDSIKKYFQKYSIVSL